MKNKRVQGQNFFSRSLNGQELPDSYLVHELFNSNVFVLSRAFVEYLSELGDKKK